MTGAAHTGQVTRSPEIADWHARVERAAKSGDRVALRDLYAQAEKLFGEGAAHEWSEVLSAFDASAQTG